MENKLTHILVVDDDDRIRILLKEYLNENKFTVSTAVDSEDAKEKIKIFKFDMIVLDVMMPGQSGYELTEELKKIFNTPIILLTAKGEVENRIKGLEIGADDYLPKPFEPKELLLRIKNILDKNKKVSLKKDQIIGKAKINIDKMIIELNGKIKKINTSEKKLLIEMISSPGKTFTREQIKNISSIKQERSIDVLITRLRQKIEVNPTKPKYLQTIRGQGYVLWIE
tara:strand:- start:532 stop:1209 length:678 start_codon:yes stop_codon:yes gene_type:complete